ncbi:MerR family transcriptional regulator [Lysobacter korlensis]|uniref:MerR family transcriptional regulator n=1 Tax=Lysobacter korlensis TaxID=553636 RepID=A0ABV6RU21_9GAMM
MEVRMEWPIHEVARLTGTTSRTLRHYGDVGLLAPSRIGPNGYRYYDEDALTRLQRILLLRELGLGLPTISQALHGQTEHAEALGAHLDWLRSERDRIDRQIASVRTTIEKLKGGEQLMAQEMFDGFDHTQYKEEVEERWGKEAYAEGDRWWRGLSDAQKREFTDSHKRLAADWSRAALAGVDPASDEAQALAQRHYQWLTAAYQGKAPVAEHLVGLGEMYVADPRFAANYESTPGDGGAQFVRDALKEYAARNLA